MKLAPPFALVASLVCVTGLVVVAGLVAAGTAQAGVAQCSKKTDCKGNRLCREGACVFPQACGRDVDCAGEDLCVDKRCVSAAEAAELQPRVCKTDTDCPGDEVCERGQCELAAEAKQAAPPAPPPPQLRSLEATPRPAPEPSRASSASDSSRGSSSSDSARGSPSSGPLRALSSPGARPASAVADPRPGPGGVDPVRLRVASDNVLHDNQSGLDWYRRPPGEADDYDSARDFCQKLTDEGGGWRLPSKEELQPVAAKQLKGDFARSIPAFAGTDNPSSFWTASAGSERFQFWTVDFHLGTAVSKRLSERARMICVRSK